MRWLTFVIGPSDGVHVLIDRCASASSIELQFCATCVVLGLTDRVPRCSSARECRLPWSSHRRHTTQNDQPTLQKEAF
ncbi:unnamed protein product [Parnassius apollo]|uniref:(apollo) hypothetical protein n=1 Tax=Parnassius apollo TaxID=110799 RepID=A0A8S3YDL8_PARAO|nr:unnamed protein product [Parnassius apollo]